METHGIMPKILAQVSATCCTLQDQLTAMNMEWKVLKDTQPFRFLFVLLLFSRMKQQVVSGQAGEKNIVGRVLQAMHAGAVLRRGARGPRL